MLLQAVNINRLSEWVRLSGKVQSSDMTFPVKNAIATLKNTLPFKIGRLLF
jgi:hypothetical protein